MLNLWHAYVRAAQVGWDANVVVAMRLMRLAVGGALAQREAQRMVAEKIAGGSPGGCDNQNANGWWNGCCDKVRFCCLSAEDAGKPTSPY